MYNNLLPMTCTRCQGYLNMPFTWSGTGQPKMCTCSKEQTLAWECLRCHKINAPWKDNCNCLPFNPMGTQPSCNDSIFPDPKGATNINYDTSADAVNRYYKPSININYDHINLKK